MLEGTIRRSLYYSATLPLKDYPPPPKNGLGFSCAPNGQGIGLGDGLPV